MGEAAASGAEEGGSHSPAGSMGAEPQDGLGHHYSPSPATAPGALPSACVH